MPFTVTAKEASNVTIVDNTTNFDIIHDIINPKCEFVVFFYEFTKDAATKIDLKTYINDFNFTAEWWRTTIVDTVAQTIQNDMYSITDAGKSFVIIPVSMVSDKIKLNITPDNVGGSDVLDVLVREYTIRPTGRR